MKKYVVVGMVLMAVWLIYRQPNREFQPGNQMTATVQPTPKPTQVHLNGTDYTIYSSPIVDGSKVTLIPNFEAKRTARQIYEQNDCQLLTNAGFYTPENKPLGLFYVDGELQNPQATSPTINGFVAKTKSGELYISQNMPDTKEIEFAFQSGPLFTPLSNLKIQNDEPDRRVLLAQNEDNNVIALAITESENSNSGPLLADLPKIMNQLNNSIRQLADETGNLKLIINLDGGSASAFFNARGIKLQEIVTVGSFLCVK